MSQPAPFVPHGIEDRAYWEAVRNNPALEQLRQAIERSVSQATPHPAPPLATDFLAARRDNNRGILDDWWQNGRRTLAALAANRLLKGLDDADPDDLLLNHLWVHATQPTWIVSAHLPNNDLPESTLVTVDLASAQMASDLAEICETLRPWMDRASHTLYNRILREIDERVLTPFGDKMTFGWESIRNNWTGVCAGYILSACESLAAMGHPRPKAKERALYLLRDFIDNCFTEHGECDEGIGYWSYGFGCAAAGWCRLTPAEYREAVDHDRLKAVADYPRLVHLYDDIFYVGNDGDLRNATPAWLANFLAGAEALHWQQNWAALSGPPRNLGAFSLLLRTLDQPTTNITEPDTAPPAALLLPDQQVAILRQETPRGELIAILGGGDNAERHNHNDIGTFVIILDKQVVVPDLGNMAYTTDFFGPKRYTYLAASSLGHCLPVIDGYPQREGHVARATVLNWDPKRGCLKLDATAAYPPEAGLKKWTRSLERTGSRVLVTDYYETAKPHTQIISRVWSTVPTEPQLDRTFAIGPLTFTAPESRGMKMGEVDPSEHRLRTWKETLYSIDIEYRTDREGRLTTEILFEVRE